jgi:hypothetical protein
VVNSGPQSSAIGNFDSSTVLAAVISSAGHVDGAPSGVAAQSKASTLLAIGLPGDRKESMLVGLAILVACCTARADRMQNASEAASFQNLNDPRKRRRGLHT